MKRFKAVVVGGTGYGGAEMIRRLLIHPEVELVRVVAVDHVGEPLGAVHPPLTGRTSLVFENVPPVEAARGADVALLGLPHKVSAHHAPGILAAGVKVVDMSGDFRLRDAAAMSATTAEAHPHPEALGTFVYGLPELNREAIRTARAVASPGCFATTIELGLLPLARAGKLAGVRSCRGNDRLVGQRRGAVRRDASPGARGEPQDVQGARAPAHAGNSRDAGGGGRAGVELRFVPGFGAAVARHPGHRLRRAAGRRDGRADRRSLRGALRTRAVRPVRSRSPARGRGGGGQQLRRGRLHAGRRPRAERARWRW